jgi:hypothetical protein
MPHVIRVTCLTSPADRPQVLIAAEMTAPFYVAVLTPVEVLKVRLQVQTVGRELYSGPIDCVRKVLSTEGSLRSSLLFLPSSLPSCLPPIQSGESPPDGRLSDSP